MKLAADRQLELDPRLLDFALRRMDRSLDGAAELVRRLDLATLAARERLSRPLLKRVLDEMSVETAPPS
jgi:chromosomal replication initiation ATPase DnaA